MRGNTIVLIAALLMGKGVSSLVSQTSNSAGALLMLESRNLAPHGNGAGSRTLILDGLFYETAQGRISIPALPGQTRAISNGPWSARATMPDGRAVTVSVAPRANDFEVSLTARPNTGIVRWGIAVEAGPEEYYTGLMERVVDGPQQASWAPGITAAIIRVGSSLKPWDLNHLWMESVEIARRKPDLRALEAGVNAWFEKQTQH